MSTVLSVSGVGGSGPKATAINFTIDEATGMRPWAWVPNSIAAQIRPGSRLVVPIVREGDIETHRSDDPSTALVRPKVQLWLSRTPDQKILVLPPETLPVAGEDDFEVTTEASEFAQRVDAKADRQAVTDAVNGTEPF